MTRTTDVDEVRLSVRDMVGVGVLVATATSAVLWTQLAVYQRLAVLESKVEALQSRSGAGAKAAAIAAGTTLLAGCSTTAGFLGTGIGAAKTVAEQPPGFESVHWVVYLASFAMFAVGAALAIAKQYRAGCTLAICGILLGVAVSVAAYYGKLLALISAVALGASLLALVAAVAWYAFKYLRKRRENIENEGKVSELAELIKEAERVGAGA